MTNIVKENSHVNPSLQGLLLFFIKCSIGCAYIKKLVDMLFMCSGKGGSKVDDAKSRLIRTMSRLHNQHNDYILAVAEANNYQSIHCQQLLPAVLDCHQAIQELFIRQL